MGKSNKNNWEIHETANGCLVAGFKNQTHDGKTPKVLIPGIGGNPRSLEPMARVYRDRSQKVLSVDTSHADGSRTMSGFARLLVRALYEELDGQPATLAPHSWAGPLAQKVAAEHPEIVENVALMATVHRGPPTRSPSLRTTLMMMNPDRSEARLNRIAGDLYGGPFRTDKDLAARLRIAHKVISKDYKRQHGALMLDMAENANPFFRAPVHKQPTVILAGEDDPLTHPDNSVELHLRLPGSVLHIIENGGHMFPITMPRETVDLIETTLADPIPLA